MHGKHRQCQKVFGSVLLRRSRNRSLEMHLKFCMNDFWVGHLMEGFGGIHMLKSTISWRQCPWSCTPCLFSYGSMFCPPFSFPVSWTQSAMPEKAPVLAVFSFFCITQPWNTPHTQEMCALNPNGPKQRFFNGMNLQFLLVLCNESLSPWVMCNPAHMNPYDGSGPGMWPVAGPCHPIDLSYLLEL